MPLSDAENAQLQAAAALRAKIDAANAAQTSKGEGPSNIAVNPDTASPWDPATAGTPQRTAPPYPISATQAAQRGFDPSGQRLAAEQAAPAQQGGGLVDRWNSFIDHPENRAGMMQFAVNMLAGRGLGESIGSAAEATGRNVATQEEEQKYEEAQALKEREQSVKESEAESYGIMARKKPLDPYERMAAAQQNALDRENRKSWDDFVKDPLARQGIMDNVTKKFPNVKSKDDLDKVGNEAARDYAQQLLLGGRLGGGGAAARPPTAAAEGGPTPVYDKKTGALKGYWDGKKFTPGAPE